MVLSKTNFDTTALKCPFDSDSQIALNSTRWTRWKRLENTMDKWTELRETITELNANNADKPDVVLVTDFLLRLMKVLDEDNKRAED